MERFTAVNLLPFPIDARLNVPFNMVISGPTGAGKSTLVESMLNPKREIFTSKFRYILIFLGTQKSENTMALNIESKYGSDICRVYENAFERMTRDQFPTFLENEIESMGGSGGLLIFDDLMVEMGECGILVPLFTRISSHFNVSNIHITQNIFHKIGGKHSGASSTIYRNTKYLVIFNSPMDNTTVEVVARKIRPKGFRQLADMINQICREHRYILIDGCQCTPDVLRYRTNIAGEAEDDEVIFQRVFVPSYVK